MASESRSERRVAIIGMACRLPGAASVEEFWNNLVNGVESISTFTEEELLQSGIDPEKIYSPHYVRSRGIIGNADHFDASFFGFTPRDAEVLDPQHRVFLECAWNALEDAGYDPEKTDARIGVFGGVGTNWHLGDVNNHPEVKKFSSGASIVTSNDKDYLTTRVSYKLNLKGPSVNVQSACSTSLVATILGMSSLFAFQSDLVLAGGATIEIPEKKGYLYQEGGMESADGRCRPFDHRANGTVFSRGAGVIVLKRLEDARRDGDHIYAVILGGAVNNDGSQKAGFTAPSVQGQIEVAVEALEMADASPDTISFVEAHGTATPLGDPIEIASLTQSFRAYTERKQYCALGSVKGNIGHTDVASGAAGLIKAALALKQGKLPASLNFESPNPRIDFANSPFFLNASLRGLPRNGSPRRALVNSFGVGGTNACVVLEEPPADYHATGPHRPWNVLLLAAKTPTALDASTANLARHLESHPELNPDDVAYTCQIGRRAFPRRRFLAFQDRGDLLAQLRNPTPGRIVDAVCDRSDGGKLVFAFPGQGNQFVGMGTGLYQSEKVFRDTVDACCEILRPVLGLDLRHVLFADDSAKDAASLLDQTFVTQPALFIISYSLAKLWMSWGVEPQAMMGHSIGEYVAACLAGVFSLKDALKAVALRGKLIQDLPGGSMLAVLRPERDMTAFLSPDVEVAAVNSPQLTVLAGPTSAIERLEAKLSAANVFHKRLATSHAFHSAMMEPALPAYASFVAGLELSKPRIPIASTVTGQWLTDGEATNPEYWVSHVRRTVRFSDAVKTILGSSTPHVFFEVGPGHSLESAVKNHLEKDSVHATFGAMRAATDSGPDEEHLMRAVGRLWTAERPISWRALYGGKEPRRASIPGYPFERQKFALDFSRNSIVVKTDAKKSNVGEWFYVPSWKRTLAPAAMRPARNGASTPERECWLLLNDDLGVADEIARQLDRLDQESVSVRAGGEFVQVSEREFVIRPKSKSDYRRLIATLKGTEREPNRVLHLWNLGGDGQPSLDSIEQEESLAFYSVFFLEQAFIEHTLMDGLRIVVAANGVFDVTGDAVRSPAKALAIGPCRVVGKEFQTIQGRFVDVSIPQTPSQFQSLARNLIEESQLQSDETIVAYRGEWRWTEIFEPAILEPSAGLGPRVKENGVYLITGGLGGLGLFFAREMARGRSVNLILTHRSPLPARNAWQQWLEEHSEQDSTSEKLLVVLELEKVGANVMLAQADVADLAAMKTVLQDAARRFGPINGVIHSAGIAGGGIISLKSMEMAAGVLESKVKGTLVLDRLFQDVELDFFALFSSITSVLGEVGRVDYCSANCFMDALVHLRNQERPERMVSINWGAWGDIGMAARWEETKALRSVAHKKASREAGGGLLRFVGKERQQELYDVSLDPESDWVINSHLVFGIPTLVGTTFIELVRQYAELKHSGNSLVLENMYFISPLMFEPGKDKRIRLFVKEDGVKHKFSFKSQSIQKDESKDLWHEHFMGELHMTATNGNGHRRFDVGALSQRLGDKVDYSPFHRVIEGDNAAFLEFGERWETLKQVTVGDREWFAKVELDEGLTADLRQYPFHPALTDVALAAAVNHVTDAPYLPYSYRRIHLHAPYTPTLWSYIRLNGDFQPGDQTLSFDVTIMDEDGTELASVERYSLKKVSAFAPPSAFNTSSSKSAAAAPRLLLRKPDDILPDEGLDALGRILNGPFLAQVVVAPSDLYGRIEAAKPKTNKADKAASQEERTTPVFSRPSSLSTHYEEPANEVEKAIADIWQGVLGIERIGVNDDFTELGGNSLLAVQTVANITDAFQVELGVEAFFKQPTVRGVAENVIGLLISMTNEDTLQDLISALEE